MSNFGPQSDVGLWKATNGTTIDRKLQNVIMEVGRTKQKIELCVGTKVLCRVEKIHERV